MDSFVVTGPVVAWRPTDPSGWHFLAVEGPVAAEIKYAALGRTTSFGSMRVAVTIGNTHWKTSLFPHKETGGYLLPIKADVRRREDIVSGSEVTARWRSDRA